MPEANDNKRLRDESCIKATEVLQCFVYDFCALLSHLFRFPEERALLFWTLSKNPSKILDSYTKQNCKIKFLENCFVIADGFPPSESLRKKPLLCNFFLAITCKTAEFAKQILSNLLIIRNHLCRAAS